MSLSRVSGDEDSGLDCFITLVDTGWGDCGERTLFFGWAPTGKSSGSTVGALIEREGGGRGVVTAGMVAAAASAATATSATVAAGGGGWLVVVLVEVRVRLLGGF